MMKSKYVLAAVLALGLLSQVAGVVEESQFVKSLTPGPFILPSEPGTWTWGMAPIYDEAGKVHIFNSIIDKKGKWTTHSKIAHWVSDKPEGPYTLLGDVFVSDIASYHNPQISKVGDTYVLVFLLNRHQDANGSKQEVGIATAQSLMGPWTESPHNPILKATEQNGEHASNPTFVATPDGKFRIYYKTMTQRDGKTYREISLASSDLIEGPYEIYEKNPLISYADQQVDVEDPYAFYYNGMYYMILEDRQDVKGLLEGTHTGKVRPGGMRPGLIYQSRDGIDWGIPKVGYQTNEFYFGHKLARTERPHILWKDGKPDYLYLACHDKDSTAGFILKINGWNGEPLEKSNDYSSHWDRVPVNIHFGKTEGVLNDAEIDFLASYNGWIVLEKRHGLQVHGSTEAGIAATAKRLKQSNPTVKVLFYLNAFINWPGYDAFETYKSEWDLRDSSGSVVYRTPDVARPDPSNPEFREWWSDVIADQMKDGLIDGVFVDALPQVLNSRLGAQIGEEKAQAVVAGVREMIALTKQKIGPDKSILANGTRGEDYREILDWSGIDGVMIEHFDEFASHDPATIKADLETIQLAADRGKFVVIKAWPGFAWNNSAMMKRPRAELLQMARERITFPLACFLVAARADSQFCYSWGYREKHGMLDAYPEFEKPLGPPEADAVWDGMTATRKFKHASVWVDLVSKEARIDWH